jgi:anti-anti-sigma factor
MSFVEISKAQGRVPITIFRLQDRINLANFRELEEVAREVYENGGRDIVIDLTETPALTSIGVRAIIVIHKMISHNGGSHLKLVCTTAAICDMLDISGVTQYIQIYDTVEDAVRSF